MYIYIYTPYISFQLFISKLYLPVSSNMACPATWHCTGGPWLATLETGGDPEHAGAEGYGNGPVVPSGYDQIWLIYIYIYIGNDHRHSDIVEFSGENGGFMENRWLIYGLYLDNLWIISGYG